MRYYINPRISGQYFDNYGIKDDNAAFSYENGNFDSSHRYLRFWGNDYAYLEKDQNCVKGCLPIPENSEAQRIIRKMAGQLRV
ncbi:MAG: hypothetical protein JW944_16395 [Deltaproteobacteria bacterium]|nr:hypothetical protein [Deltaproteobacteria bacterium]